MYQHTSSRTAVTARSGRCGSSLATLRAIATQRRREHVWAWGSLLLLLMCWDASLRLDEKVSMPRPHRVELEQEPQARREAIRADAAF